MNEPAAASRVHDTADGFPSTDLEAILQRPDLVTVPLRRDDRELLDELPGLGAMVATTGKACASCAWMGTLSRVIHLDGGSALFGEGGSLCWIAGSWRHTLAVMHRDEPEHRPSLMFFGERGELVHRITPTGPGAWEDFRALVDRHQGCANCLRHSVPTVPEASSFDCPGSLLHAAWRESRSPRDLDLRLTGIGVDRLQAVRAMEGLYTTPIPLCDFHGMIEHLAAERLPVHLEVGNRHCTQALEGTPRHLDIQGVGWRIKTAQATLQVMPALIQSIWGVAQPGPDAERYRIEVYDGSGEQVLALACPLKTDPGTTGAWERVQATLEAERPQRRGQVMPITSVGVDLAKLSPNAEY
jgi:putative heme degradation protein